MQGVAQGPQSSYSDLAVAEVGTQSDPVDRRLGEFRDAEYEGNGFEDAFGLGAGELKIDVGEAERDLSGQ